MPGAETKTERIDLRTTPSAKDTLQRAAEATGKSVSEFVIEAGLAAAAETLADRRFFVLDEAAWHEFEAVLDRPVAAKPQLARLLAEPSAIE